MAARGAQKRGWRIPQTSCLCVRRQREMLALGEAGYKEVTLLGQNVDAYGRDLPGAASDGISSALLDSDLQCNRAGW